MINVTLVNDYITLCKPKVVLLMLITAWVGMYMASDQHTTFATIAFASIGIACAAGSAAIINHYIDRRLDLMMTRTEQRPIASGRISAKQALLFALALSICALWCLLAKVNLITSLLTFGTLFGYALIYTIYLKHATPQNIVIGGLAGAMPPLLGWAAVSGDINSYSMLLVLIIFTWTPPHFWALAIYRVNDYAKANIPMLPVTHGIKFTKLCLLLYTILLCVVTLLPFVVGMSAIIYLLSATLLNIIFLYFAIRLYLAKDVAEHRLAIKTFNFSLLYLLLLFGSLLIDHSWSVCYVCK